MTFLEDEYKNGFRDKEETSPADHPPQYPEYGGEQSSFARERMSQHYEDDSSKTAGFSQRVWWHSLLDSRKLDTPFWYGITGVSVMLVVIFGGWAIFGGNHKGLPLITPPKDAAMVRPKNPGGMQYSEPSILDNSNDGRISLAPAPEQPMPDALRAQIENNMLRSPSDRTLLPSDGNKATDKISSKGAYIDASATVDSTLSARGAEGGQSPLSSGGRRQTQALQLPGAAQSSHDFTENRNPQSVNTENKALLVGERKVKATDRNTSRKSIAPKSENQLPITPKNMKSSIPQIPGGRYVIQLATLESEKAARQYWIWLKTKHASLFAGRTAEMTGVRIKGTVIYRLRLTGFKTAKMAQAFCYQAHMQKVVCNQVSL